MHQVVVRLKVDGSAYPTVVLRTTAIYSYTNNYEMHPLGWCGIDKLPWADVKSFNLTCVAGCGPAGS